MSLSHSSVKGTVCWRNGRPTCWLWWDGGLLWVYGGSEVHWMRLWLKFPADPERWASLCSAPLLTTASCRFLLCAAPLSDNFFSLVTYFSPYLFLYIGSFLLYTFVCNSLFCFSVLAVWLAVWPTLCLTPLRPSVFCLRQFNPSPGTVTIVYSGFSFAIVTPKCTTSDWASRLWTRAIVCHGSMWFLVRTVRSGSFCYTWKLIEPPHRLQGDCISGVLFYTWPNQCKHLVCGLEKQ